MISLRPYQNKAIELTRGALSAGSKRPLIVMPTGAGKSPVFGEVISLASLKGKISIFLCHRRNLVYQFRETLLKHFGIDPGFMMAGEDYSPGLQVYVGTVQTYQRRLKLGDRFEIPADIIFVDEAHLSVSKRYTDIFEAHGNAIVIGTTATPCRSDQRGLGEVYDNLIDVVGTQELTDDGFLAPVRYFVPSDPDLGKIKIKMGDYDNKELAAKVDKPKIVGDVVDNWLKYAEGRNTIVFAVNVAHSKHIREGFDRVGIPSAHLDAKSSDDERDRVFKQMEDGEIKIVCNCALYQEGMDVPDISCVVIARPTKSLALYRQCAGRGMRISEGHDDMILLDHGGVVDEHGLLTDDIMWTLDGGKKAWSKKKKEEKDKKLVICRSCKQVFESRDNCPDCGTEVKSFGRDVETVNGGLEEVGSKTKATMAEKRIFYGMALGYSREKGWSDGAAAHKYREKYGVWPKGMKSMAPIKPDIHFLAYMKHLAIKWYKSKEGKAA